MAVSGSIDYSVNRDDIIKEALELLSVLGEEEEPTYGQIESSASILNMMVKNWQARGLNLFAVQKVYALLEKNKHEYTFNSSGDHFTTSFVETTINGAVSSGASSITVDNASSISDGDYIGIYLDDGTMQWTTVNGAPSGSTVTLTASLTDDVNDGAVVYSYTTKASRPMKILEAYIHEFNGSETEIEKVARSTYYSLPNKDVDGQVNQIYYDPQISSPKLYIWPETSDPRDYLVLLVQKTLSDFDNSEDTPDFPQEWYMPIVYNLALYLAPKYGISRKELVDIASMAEHLYKEAEGFDIEWGTSVTFQPDRTYG